MDRPAPSTIELTQQRLGEVKRRRLYGSTEDRQDLIYKARSFAVLSSGESLVPNETAFARLMAKYPTFKDFQKKATDRDIRDIMAKSGIRTGFAPKSKGLLDMKKQVPAHEKMYDYTDPSQMRTTLRQDVSGLGPVKAEFERALLGYDDAGTLDTHILRNIGVEKFPAFTKSQKESLQRRDLARHDEMQERLRKATGFQTKTEAQWVPWLSALSPSNPHEIYFHHASGRGRVSKKPMEHMIYTPDRLLAENAPPKHIASGRQLETLQKRQAKGGTREALFKGKFKTQKMEDGFGNEYGLQKADLDLLNKLRGQA